MSETEPLLRGNYKKIHKNDATARHIVNDVGSSLNSPGDTRTAVYLTRWYVLVIMSLSVALQNACWGIWGPIAQSAKTVYSWSTGMLALMINCGNIGVLTGLIPAGYVVHKTGLRVSLLLITFCLTISPALRAITFKPVVSSILVGFGQYFAGVAGSLTQVTFASLSETWFPSNERTTATTISVLSNAIGGAAAFVLGPWIVSQPKSDNGTSTNITNDTVPHNDSEIITNVTDMENQIRMLNLIETGFGGTLLLLVLLYFPKKPPKPPSLSASVHRQEFKEGFAKLLKNVDIWRINALCGIVFAVFVNWLGLLDLNLQHLNISQKEAGWFGFYAFTAGSVGGIVIGRLADRFQRRLKWFLVVLLVLSALVAAWITCMRNEYIIHSKVLFAVAIAILGLLMYTTFPLNLEFACEIGYPVSEEIVGMCVGIAINTSAVIFLLVQTIPGVGVAWMNWTMLGLLVLPVMALLTFRETYNRMNVDAER